MYRKLKHQKHFNIKLLLVAMLSASLLCSCANKTSDSTYPSEDSTLNTSIDSDTASDFEITTTGSGIGQRPTLLQPDDEGISNFTAQVTPYTINKDFSNVSNFSRFYLTEDAQEKLLKNGFLVSQTCGNEFYEIYETNRYSQIPNFVTVDSLMHTYHVYFSYLLKNIEKTYLADSLSQLSQLMLTDSISQYASLKGTEWEDAARRNVAFFTIGAKLSDDSVEINSDVMDIVTSELTYINQAEGISISPLININEDYSQYKPRGYYEDDSQLEAYFKAMMWYGRISFCQDNDDLNRSALLITKALAADSDAYNLWASIYAVTSFFAGASDDLGVCEYIPIIYDIYGENAEYSDLIGNGEAFVDFTSQISMLSAPQINSIPIYDGEDNVIPSFRFMGQRFTIDSFIMQQLIYSNVLENADNNKRMLPDVLDIPAALGSDTALNILNESGKTSYPNYMENIDKLRTTIENADNSFWYSSLYSNWLNTLRPLLDEKGDGYPMFMQSEEWTKKNLECFAGSYTELKHDTVLYAKQVIAEMGGYVEPEWDDRGYVEPEPLVYSRFTSLATQMLNGLKTFNMINENDEENLSHLAELSQSLYTISIKELSNELLTDEEYELIRSYGGNIEHFWYDAMAAMTDTDKSAISTQDYPAAIVVDIATNPDGSVLEAATGNPSMIIVAVCIDGDIKLASGSVYSFYQFEQPINNRLTDTDWRIMMGFAADENNEYHFDSSISKPEWTESYRYEYEW